MALRARRVVDAARSNVPEGTFSIGAGLAIGSLAAWGYQIFAERHLTDPGYNAVNALWVLTFVATPGFFQPLEQEVARAMAHRRAEGVGGGPVLWKAARLGAIVAAVLAVASVASAFFAPSLINQLFKKVPGQWLLLASFVVALFTYASAYLARGALSGNSRFRNYGLMHGTEGVLRILAVVAIILLSHQVVTDSHGVRHTFSSPGLFGLALVLPPIIAVTVSLWGQHDLAPPGPDAPWSELSSALAWLLASSVFAQALSYAPVFAAELLVKQDSHSQALLAGFVTAMFLARVPLLMFQAVQAALLPKLSANAAEGKHDEFRNGLMRLLVIVLGIAAIGVLGSLAIGRPVGKLIFHDKWDLNNGGLAFLAAGAGAYIVAFTLAQGLIALRAYSRLTLGWGGGALAFMLVMPWGLPGFAHDVFTRAELAFLVSSCVAAVVIIVQLFRTMATSTATFEELVEVIHHEPLEF
jgi:O-antigen/teichoic acid export membrane protein